MDIKALHEALVESDKEMKALVDRQSEEIKKHGETTAETAKKLAEAEARFEQRQQDMKALDERLIEVEKKAARQSYETPQEQKSPGERFVESEAFEIARKRGARSVDAVEIGRFLDVKNISSAAASAGSILNQYRVPEIFYDPGQRLQHVRQLMNVGTTTESAVEFMRELVYTNNAGPQWDSDASVADFAKKPQSNITFELVTAPVRTLAHWFPASRQVLSDIPQMRSHIDGRGRYGLMLEEDKQVLYGTGSDGDLEGLMVTTGVQNAGERAVGDNFLDHIRRAIALASTSEYIANGILLNPLDWAEIELTKGTNGQYVWAAAPASGGGPNMWRVPVIESTAIQQGEFLLGNWSMGAQLWDREQASIRVSESHEDFFVRNAVAIVIEERVTLTTYRPKAFVKGVFDLVST